MPPKIIIAIPVAFVFPSFENANNKPITIPEGKPLSNGDLEIHTIP
jgi:hypothetical protein